MISLKENQFYKLKRENKVFPITLVFSKDKVNIEQLFNNLKGKNKFLLESYYSNKEKGRYSFMGSNPYMSIKSIGENITVDINGEKQCFNGKVLDYVEKFVHIPYNSSHLDIPFIGGAVGYVGYDVIRQYEKLEQCNRDCLNLPESYLMFYKYFVCFDYLQKNISIVYNVFPESEENYEEILDKLSLLKEEILSENKLLEATELDCKKQVESNFTKEDFCKAVDKAKTYIEAGDIFQVVLSQRLKFKTSSQPFEVYRRLTDKNPSPYAFYIEFDGFIVVGSSPETLVKVKENKVITNPIAGTRPRGDNYKVDIKMKKQLLNDEKEKAEHIMLVDLARNDIGKISEFGSVNIEKFMEVDFYSHVMHIVSMVSGKLKKELSCIDALKACLPVGTVSGAPKIRAMEIIDELENTKRGIYAGAIGYFSFNKNMDTAIAIRTIVFRDEYAYVQAGAGIVYDSDPEKEYIETLNKAMALREVI